MWEQRRMSVSFQLRSVPSSLSITIFLCTHVPVRLFLSDSKPGLETGWAFGEGWLVPTLSSENMPLDNPIEMVNITLVNRHQSAKESMLL